MKHQEFRNRVAYARRNKELVAENEAMKLKIRRFAKGYKRVVKKLLNLRDKYEDVSEELEFTEANLKELHKGYTNICNANMELEQRVQQLVDEYSNEVCQSGAQEKRKDKDQLKQELFEMREQYDKLEREYKELRFLAKGIHSFVKEKKLYIKKDNECPYCRRGITACSPYCRVCGSCLSEIYGLGVICEKRLKEANVSLPSDE